MSEQEKWMPSDEEIDAAASNVSPFHDGDEWIPNREPIRALIRAAVEKALAEQEARHKREVIRAGIEELTHWYDSDADDFIGIRIHDLRAELAALEVKP